MLANGSKEEMYEQVLEFVSATPKKLLRPPVFPETASTPNTHSRAGSNTTNSGVGSDTAYDSKDRKELAKAPQRSVERSEMRNGPPKDDTLMEMFDETLEKIKNVSVRIRQYSDEAGSLSLRIQQAEMEKKELDVANKNSSALLRVNPDGKVVFSGGT